MPKARIATSVLWSFMEQGTSKLIALVVQIILARLVSPEEFGLLAILLVITSIADSIAQSGFGMALIQKTDATDRSFDTAFWLSIGIAIALYVIIFLLAPFLASFYGMEQLPGSLRVLALIVLFNAANSIQRSWMQKRMEFKGLFRISLVAVICSGAVGIAAASFGLGIWALVMQAIAQSVVTCFAMVFVVPWRPHFRFSRSEAAELYRYGWKVCVTGILNVFYTGVSELILGKACTANELGFYSQGRKYPNAAIGVASNAMANVLFPAFASVKDNTEQLLSHIKKALQLGTAIMAPVSLLAAAVAEPIVAILLGDAWMPCVPIFSLACASNALIMLQLVNLRAYMALGRSDLYLFLQIAKVTLGVVGIGGVALVTHNIYATAWATFIVGLVCVVVIDMQPAASVLGYGCVSQLRDVAPMLLISLIAFLAAVAVTLLGLHYLAELFLQCIVYGVVYLSLSKICRITAFDEVVSMARSFGGRKGKS